MQDPRSSSPGRPPRRLILGAAFALGLAVALAPRVPIVMAAGPSAAVSVVQADATREDPVRVAQSTGKAAPEANGAPAQAPGAAVAAPAPPAVPPVPPIPAAKAPAGGTPDADADADADASSDAQDADKEDVTVDSDRIVIQKGNKRVHVGVFGRDRQYDSFEQFVQDAPWLAGLVFLTVLLVFLVPLLIIVLLIWYKIRKNRMANETMLKLAERGIVPPAAAMDAVATGTAASVADAATTPPAGVPAYEHARALHRRAIWSDLRKGIVLSGIGLGLTAFSMLDDGTPNSVGLICLFVGVGYCLLWFLEDRTRGPARDAPGAPPPAGGA
jgi:hypothetical protein